MTIKTTKAVLSSIALFALASLPAGLAGAATITVVNFDGPGEGFNDATPVTPVTGNSGTTLGQQRLIAFQGAADAWGAVIASNVEILVAAEINPLFCDPVSAVLGLAGAVVSVRDNPAFPRPATWYPIALGNSLAGVDLAPGSMTVPDEDIRAVFNGNLDAGNPSCLGGKTWWYGLGAPAPAGTEDFFSTVFHEIAHGLGFSTLVDRVTGARPFGFDDTFMVNLEDHSSGELWPEMTDGERAASAVDTGDLHWVGVNAVSRSGMLDAGTHPGGHVRMYAPDPLEGGSSVSHWDTELFPDEIMEPFAVPGAQDIVTTALLEDLAWPLLAPGDDDDDCDDTATTLCLPGDDRFEVSVYFETVQGGGRMGDAQAISLAPIGVSKGGIFVFSDLANPELLVKVLDGCAINNRYWVFYAATTNVGFELTVTDTVAQQTQVFINPDQNPANAVTDTQAFATCP